jgi:DNA-binding CsgD family transcriptional regulator
MDPATVIETRFRTVNLPPHDGRIAEFEYMLNDVNKFADLARARRHSGVLSEATAGHPFRSARYRALNDYGVRGELRASLVVGGACWGAFALFREAPNDFSGEERDAAHDLAVILGGGFRTAMVRGTVSTGSVARGPGLIVFDGERRVESMTAAARDWVTELRFAEEPTFDGLPHALLTVAESARSSERDATVRVPGTSGGWISLHAAPVLTGGGEDPGEAGRVAVIAQGADAPSIAPLIAAAYGLSRRERELTELVLQGCGTSEIAARLYISPHTVQEHLKSIFAKAQVRSRRELVGQVFLRHYQPRMRPVEPAP